VTSSSLEAPSISTEGRMATGGTGTTLRSRSSGRPAGFRVQGSGWPVQVWEVGFWVLGFFRVQALTA
jgi:hypothetical protein